MTTLFVIYPRTSGTQLNMTYYHDQHRPLVHRLLDPAGLRALRLSVPATANESFHLIAALVFNDLRAAQSALAEHAPVLQADLPRFTNVVPQMFLAEE